jgi:restriction system protein
MVQTKISLDRMDEFMREVFKELQARESRAKGKDVLAAIAPRLDLTDHEKGTTKTGAVRWDTHIRFYSSGCVKAGFLHKSNGYWTLTQDGIAALALPKGQLIRAVNKRYQIWRKQQGDDDSAEVDVPDDDSPEVDVPDEEEAAKNTLYEQAVEDAQTELEDHIGRLGPYDFQKLVSELLTAMGYYVSYVAPPGPDGGIDLAAYKDPLGTSTPRIRCQIKHRPSAKVTAKEIRELEGLLRKDGDMGLFISTAGFTSDAERELRASHRHIETMAHQRLVELWKKHYDHVSERGKSLLPLVPVYFIAPQDA